MVRASSAEWFDVALAERLRSRRHELESVFWRLGLFSTLLNGVLFINAVILPTKLSLFGVSSDDVSKIKEVLIVISSTVSLGAGLVAYKMISLSAMLRAYSEKEYRDAPAREVMRLLNKEIFSSKYPFPHKVIGAVYPTALTKIVQIAFPITLMFVLVLFVAGSGFVHVIVLIDMWRNPNFSIVWTVLITAYAAGGWFCSMYLITPLPYRDYNVVVELSRLRDDKEAHARRLRELLREKGFLDE